MFILMERMTREEAMNLPLAVAYQIEHCALVNAGKKCAFDIDAGGELEDLFSALGEALSPNSVK